MRYDVLSDHSASTNDKFMKKILSKSLNYVLQKGVSDFWYLASFLFFDQFLKTGTHNPSPYFKENF